MWGHAFNLLADLLTMAIVIRWVVLEWRAINARHRLDSMSLPGNRRFAWWRRLRTPTYQCPECRRSYHFCACDVQRSGRLGTR